MAITSDDRLSEDLVIAMYMTLAFYADPESYFATAFMFDPPCGEFREDFSVVPDSDFEREMPGKRARAICDLVQKEFDSNERLRKNWLQILGARDGLEADGRSLLLQRAVSGEGDTEGAAES